MLDCIPLPSPRLTATISPDTQDDIDVLVVGLRAEETLPPSLNRINEATDGWFDRLVKLEQVRSKQGELTLLASPIPTGPTMILIVGLGSSETCRQLSFDSASSAIRRLADRPRDHIAIVLAESFPESMHDAIVAGTIFGCEEQGIYQTDPAFDVPAKVSFGGMSNAALERGKVIGESINQTRRLVNEPPAAIYPESFVARATAILSGTDVSIDVWNTEKLESEGCRAILAVGAGSVRSPRLMIMRYNGGGDEAPVAIVGKGVTFDSGGLSLKPSESMVDMKCDMAGAATVVGVMNAVAKLELKQNVVGFCGLAENMVSGSSYKLGDVIETRSGKTIEILNTDAEGRVVLADTLDVAIQIQPRAVVDLATLTGACMVALGTEVAGLMSNDQPLCDAIQTSASTEGEPVWQLPMFDLFDDKIKSNVADIKNVGEGRWGGAITAAKFLENFVGDVPWVHIDVAGPAFSDRGKPHRAAGASGAMVRTVLRWIETL